MGQTDPVGDSACPVLPQQAAQGASSLQQTVCDSATPQSQNLPEYFKKLRLMWKGNHLVLLEYVLNPGFGKRWISSPYRKNFPSLGAQSCARHGGKELVRVLPWFPAQSQVPVPEVPLPGRLSEPGPAASPVWCSVLWKTFPCNCFLQNSSLALQCGCSGSRGGRCCACGSDPVWQFPFL